MVAGKERDEATNLDPIHVVNVPSVGMPRPCMWQSFKPPGAVIWLVNKMGKGGRGHVGRHPNPNDQRSNAKTPTSHENKASVDNQGAQLNPISPEFKGPAPRTDEQAGGAERSLEESRGAGGEEEEGALGFGALGERNLEFRIMNLDWGKARELKIED